MTSCPLVGAYRFTDCSDTSSWFLPQGGSRAKDTGRRDCVVELEKGLAMISVEERMDRDQRGRDRRPQARHPARRARDDRGQPGSSDLLGSPYPGTTGYGAYGLLDTLLGDDLPAAPAPRLADLSDAAVAAPIVVLSYGGPGVTLTDVTAQVARHRPVAQARAIPYPRLRVVAKEHTNATSHEYLVIARR